MAEQDTHFFIMYNLKTDSDYEGFKKAIAEKYSVVDIPKLPDTTICIRKEASSYPQVIKAIIEDYLKDKFNITKLLVVKADSVTSHSCMK